MSSDIALLPEVRLQNAAGGASIGTLNRATLTIHDDDIAASASVSFGQAATAPAVAHTSDGYVLAWQEGVDADASTVLFQSFGNDGQEAAAPERLGKPGAAAPAVVVGASGRPVVVWHEPIGAIDRRVVAQVLGGETPDKRLVIADEGAEPRGLAVAADGSGGYLASWIGEGEKLLARRFDAGGVTSELFAHPASPGAGSLSFFVRRAQRMPYSLVRRHLGH